MKDRKLIAFNSTRCIRNTEPQFQNEDIVGLSTPHGALGTLRRCIPEKRGLRLSTPHGALGTLGVGSRKR